MNIVNENFQDSQKSFSEIIKKYESVNSQFGTDKSATHSYDTIYEKLFLPFRNKKITMLEIGLFSGADLLAFDEYFKDVELYGIDITDKYLMPELKNYDNINIFIGDATKENTVNHFNKLYDIIIEDGSHLAEHQIQHFKDYNKYVKQGGIYIIEDVDEKYLEKVKMEISKTAMDNNFILEVYDLRKNKNRYDDILLVYKKK